MSARRLQQSWVRAVVNAQEAATHSGVTIAARLPVLAQHLLTPSVAGMTEWNDAYTEKVQATWEGAVAASLEWQAMMFRSAFSAPTPAGFANDLMQVVHKAGHPARRRVKANAKRFSGPKR